MEDAKPTRTLNDVKTEYQQRCSQAGEIQYRLEIMKAELSQVNNAIFELNKEAQALSAAPATSAATPTVEVKQ